MKTGKIRKGKTENDEEFGDFFIDYYLKITIDNNAQEELKSVMINELDIKQHNVETLIGVQVKFTIFNNEACIVVIDDYLEKQRQNVYTENEVVEIIEFLKNNFLAKDFYVGLTSQEKFEKYKESKIKENGE